MAWIWKCQKISWLDLIPQPMDQVVFWLASFGKPNYQRNADTRKPDKEKLQAGRSEQKIQYRHRQENKKQVWDFKSHDHHLLIQALTNRSHFQIHKVS